MSNKTDESQKEEPNILVNTNSKKIKGFVKSNKGITLGK